MAHELADRVVVLEAMVGVPQEEAGTMVEQIQAMAGSVQELTQLAFDMQKEHANRYTNVMQHVRDLSDKFEVQLNSLKADVLLMKRAITATDHGEASSSSRGGDSSDFQKKIKVPEPKEFA